MKSFLIVFFSLSVIFHPSRICFAAEPLTETRISAASQVRERAVGLSKIWNRESIGEAAALYLESSELSENHDNLQSASDLREASRLNLILGETKLCLSLLEKSLKLENKEGNLDGTAETLAQIAYIHSSLGNYDESSKSLTELLSLLKKIKSSKIKAGVYYYLGEIYFARQDIPSFLDFYARSLELYRELNDAAGEAKTLWSLAYAHLGNDDLQNGISFAQKSLEKWREIGDQRGITLSTIAVGLAFFRLGQSTKALTFFNRADDNFPAGIDKIEKGILLNNIARVYETLGDCDGSIDNFKKAAKIFDEEKNLSFALGNLATLGSISYKCGYKEESLDYLQKSLQLAKQTKSGHEEMFVHTELAHIYSNENLFSKSEAGFKEALGLDKSDDYKLDKSRALSGLGELYLKSGKLDLARANYLDSLKIASEIKDKFSMAETLFELAKFYSIEADWEKSVEYAEKSIEVTENLYTDVLNSKLKQSYLSNVFDRYEFYINLLMKTHKNLRNDEYLFRALQVTEKSRARFMLENLSLAEADFIKDADPEVIKREKEIRVLLNSKADKLTDLLSQNTNQNEIDEVSRKINELENELENIKAALKENSPIYSAIKNPAPFDVGEFQRNVLDENSLLLEFSFGKTESYLWLIGKNEFASYVLPPRERIEDKIQKLRELLASREMKKDETIDDFQTRIAQSEREYVLISGELSRDLFGQVADKFGDKKLIVVPDGKLGVFPVAALPLPNSEKNEPILLSNEVVYEPSASTLSLIAKFGRQAGSPSKSLLIFSDPVFSTDDDRLSGKVRNDDSAQNERAESFRFVESLNSLGRLAASKTEADSIVNILGQSNVESFSGFAANRERLLSANVSDYRILHFATHGLIDENRPELSGIVLSRFDENGRKQDEFFRLHDIYGMNLNSDLVVLSACSTGVGKEIKGEGLLSLNNAFLSVGAKSVLSSLWKVEDGATLELMKNFYEAMANERLTPSKALQKAQIEMMKSDRYKSPFYWAAFTVQGDFTNVPQISGGFVAWKYFLPATLLVLFGAFWGIRVIRRRNRM